jgi:hypothetical protein
METFSFQPVILRLKTFNAFLRPAPKEPPATKTTLEPEQIKLDMKPDTNTVKVNVDKPILDYQM